MTQMSSFATDILRNKYAQVREDGTQETWDDVADRVASNIMGPVFPDYTDEMAALIRDRKFMPGGRYLYASGRQFQQIANCYTLIAEDSREGWAKITHDAMHALMSGGGIGVYYGKIREAGAKVTGLGGASSGPIGLMETVNELARHVMAGGSRRAAVYASLPWWHPDVEEFIKLKNWDDDTVARKAKDFNARAPMDFTNISVALDDEFFELMDGARDVATYRLGHHDIDRSRDDAQHVYRLLVESMLTTGEPGIQIDVGENAGEVGRNACTELTTRDHLDICNLGSLNLSQITDLDEMKRTTFLSTLFLLAGTIVGAVPLQEVDDVRTRTRRLGLGLMGIYEWLVARGRPYGPDDELEEWLKVYRDVSRAAANAGADIAGVSRPTKVRAIAPTGTIGILAETTSGIEPLFATAYKRRYLKGKDWHFQYVVDEGARRLQEAYGVHPDKLETAYDLAYHPERRIAFQAWVQRFVDHGISSTLNLPSVDAYAIDTEKFGTMLYRYLPGLRGITAYPDGARGGQPLTVVPYTEAEAAEGLEFEEYGAENACVGGVCGI